MNTKCKTPRFRLENFWMDDITELFKNGNYIKFFPKYDSSRTEQMNAITRFCIYLIIIMIFFEGDENWLYVPITLIVIMVILHNINKIDNLEGKKELKKVLKLRRDKRIEDKKIDQQELKHDGDKEVSIDIDNNSDSITELNTNEHIEAGYYDSENNLVLGSKISVPKYRRNKEEPLYNIDEILEYNKNTCRRPTKENPFMNPDVLEYNSGDPPVACNSDDEDINDSMKVHFNHDLFQNVDERFERKNSQRQFYTIPNTAIPNNQIEFAQWLYKVPKTCKEDQEQCLRHFDLRFNREDILP